MNEESGKRLEREGGGLLDNPFKEEFWAQISYAV